MHIVLATDNYWPRVSGMAVSVDTFAQEFRAAGHEVSILAPDYPGAQAQDLTCGRQGVFRFASWRLFFSQEDRLVTLGAQKAVFALLDRLQPDVVHVQTELLMGRAAWRWAKRNQVPLVMTAHTHWETYINHYLPFPPAFGRALARHIMRSVLGQAEVVVTPSEPMRQVLEQYGISRPIVVLPTGFQASAFAQIDRAHAKRDSYLFEKYPQLRGRPVLLTVGRVAQEKNLEFLLQVVEQLVQEMPDLVWLLVGDGPSLAVLQKQVVDRGLANHVVTTGYICRDQVQHAYALGDVFVLASETETQGLATIEALGSGLPVVAVDQMGSTAMLAGELGGFLVPAELDTFACKVKALLEDPLLWACKASGALQTAKQWAPAQLSDKMLNVYQGVIEAHRQAARLLVGQTPVLASCADRGAIAAQRLGR